MRPLTTAAFPPRSAAARVRAHPDAFALRVLKGFRANQGLLLAGAVAYYALLSLVPLLILDMIVRSHAIDPERLLSALTEYLAFVVLRRSDELVRERRLAHPEGRTAAVYRDHRVALRRASPMRHARANAFFIAPAFALP
jgi:hypothetical protein